MSDVKLKYILGQARYANAENLTGNVKICLPLTHKELPEDEIIETISLAQRYDRERQASPIHRIYGRLNFITTNELTNYDPTTLTLVDSTSQSNNYNLQLLYPSSHMSNISLKDFSCDSFPLLCTYYDNSIDCDNHKIYHGLPFVQSRTLTYNGRTATVINTYKHKNGNNINPEDYVYIIPGKGGSLNSLYGFVKVNNIALDDGTPNVLILDKNVSGDYAGSYKKVIDPSDNDIQFLNTITCELYVTSTTINELFVCTSEQHNVIVGDFIDLRQSGDTFNQYNGIHKVNRVLTEFIYTCSVPAHLLSSSISSPSHLVPDITNILPTTFAYQYRVLDGAPSEYYARKFKVLAAGDNTSIIYDMDYYLQQLYLSNTIWKNVVPPQYNSCDTVKQSGSDDDRIVSYVFNNDIDISPYVDNWGRPLTELYLGVIKRKNPTAQFNSLITNFQGSLIYSGITVFYKELNLPTYTDPTVKAGLNYFSVTDFNDAGFSIGGEYYGDLCEFSIATVDETTLDPFQFRIGKIIGGIDVEGYVYEPFKRIQLRYFSTDVEDLDNNQAEFPFYSLPYHTSYRWKDINPYGYKEIVQTGVRSVDNPFVNGAHYDFADTFFYLRRQNKNPDVKITIYDSSC